MTRLLLVLTCWSLMLPLALAQEDLDAEIAELEQQIEAKGKELGELKSRLASLRTQKGRLRRADDGIFRKTAELLAPMQKDAFPEPGPDREPERVAANRWLANHLVGETIELKGTVSNVVIHSQGTTFVVHFDLDHPLHETKNQFPSSKHFAWGGKAELGGQPVQTKLHLAWEGKGRPDLRFRADDAFAREIREKKGKEITVRAEIARANFYYDNEGLAMYLIAQPPRSMAFHCRSPSKVEININREQTTPIS